MLYTISEVIYVHDHYFAMTISYFIAITILQIYIKITADFLDATWL